MWKWSVRHCENALVPAKRGDRVRVLNPEDDLRPIQTISEAEIRLRTPLAPHPIGETFMRSVLFAAGEGAFAARLGRVVR